MLESCCCVEICLWARNRCKAYFLTSLLVLQAAGSSVKAGVDTATVGLEYAKNVRSPGRATLALALIAQLLGPRQQMHSLHCM